MATKAEPNNRAARLLDDHAAMFLERVDAELCPEKICDEIIEAKRMKQRTATSRTATGSRPPPRMKSEADRMEARRRVADCQRTAAAALKVLGTGGVHISNRDAAEAIERLMDAADLAAMTLDRRP